MNRFRWILLAIILSVGASSAYFVRLLRSPRIIVEAETPNGYRVCVVQTLGEPFNTSTYVRDPNGQWQWFYLDHEDVPWLAAVIEKDSRQHRVKIVGNGARRAEYDWETGLYYIGNDNGRDGSPMPPGWDLFKDLKAIPRG